MFVVVVQCYIHSVVATSSSVDDDCFNNLDWTCMYEYIICSVHRMGGVNSTQSKCLQLL